jgi:predicted nucleic acid-binding protein
MTKPLIAFDSCTIIHLLAETPTWYRHVKAIYDDALTGKHMIVISEVTVAECQRLEAVGGKKVTHDESARMIAQFFNRPFIVRRGLTSRESVLAGQLIRTHGVGTCDALIAATAVFAGAKTLYTTDGCSHRRKDGKLLSVGVVETDCGKRMTVEPPDVATCAAIQAGAAAPVAAPSSPQQTAIGRTTP